MKLARIEHTRCQEWDGNTHVLIPDDWDGDKFRGVVNKCVTKMIEAAKKAKDTSETSPSRWTPWGVSIPYKEFPDKTVKEVNAWWADQKRIHEEWLAEIEPIKVKFSDLLKEEGIKQLWEAEEILTADAYWGHHHGISLEYKFDTPQNAKVVWESDY